MPTRADLELAVPRCDRIWIIPNPGASRQHGRHVPCWTPMTYEARGNFWRCGCGNAVRGESVAAHRATVLEAA